MIAIQIQREAFDPGALQADLEALGGGGVATFTGVVRGEGGLSELVLEHHAAMTTKAVRAIADRAAARWTLLGLTIVHRHGSLVPGDRIVFVGVAARHRGPALEACAFLIDWLKTHAPFWKRETFADGTTRWVEPRAEDDAAAARWGG
ncbi:molybdopterin synthase catalytic subunit [Sphingomonas vulcanisoli]|uniref:Molybdopterin synthase catalytic subunit n=1 Tax=Sphingomonas vulcanisoli TaxID=1658060 RepID=A0ABX0TWT6_9SPHN|nr:molybdenum cofactor biosynthesis protein MoaE [Sphingomonas vulcanisoli]NIJ08850.1 molybdopterin synthase catalytic subunit [Sphingomonas vulcanisoli]